MTPWSPPISAILYGSLLLALAFGFLFFGGASRLRQLFQPPSSANSPTLQIPLPPFLCGISVISMTAYFYPPLIPGTAIVVAFFLLTLSRQKPISFWGLHRLTPIQDLTLALRTIPHPFSPKFFFFSSSALASFFSSGFPSNLNPR